MVYGGLGISPGGLPLICMKYHDSLGSLEKSKETAFSHGNELLYFTEISTNLYGYGCAAVVHPATWRLEEYSSNLTLCVVVFVGFVSGTLWKSH